MFKKVLKVRTYVTAVMELTLHYNVMFVRHVIGLVWSRILRMGGINHYRRPPSIV